ncbi:MAG: NADH-quinone oxidoreductase subunit H [Candidatus Omnitrophica bacterium]|nr:NADH-quinone oxidoreductase subunit H [Candidatus Omnitrophota bacterium]
MNIFLNILLYLILAPLTGGLLAGLDRKITARMQSRIGPPILQPFFDVLKLIQKENLVVRRSQNFYIGFFLVLVVFTGALFFTGKDILLVIFAFTLAAIFFVLAGFKASSPYSFIGAHRELLQMMAYEPIIILSAVGMYMVTRSFYVSDIVSFARPLIYYLPGILFGLLYILAMKFRKSPFDLSTSHHAHQELVKGITTEFSGKALAMIELAHWYENMLVLGFIYLFFAHLPIAGVLLSLLAYFLVILIDNTFARVKWQLALLSCWLVTLIFGFGNILVLFILPK